MNILPDGKAADCSLPCNLASLLTMNCRTRTERYVHRFQLCDQRGPFSETEDGFLVNTDEITVENPELHSCSIGNHDNLQYLYGSTQVVTAEPSGCDFPPSVRAKTSKPDHERDSDADYDFDFIMPWEEYSSNFSTAEPLQETSERAEKPESGCVTSVTSPITVSDYSSLPPNNSPSPMDENCPLEALNTRSSEVDLQAVRDLLASTDFGILREVVHSEKKINVVKNPLDDRNRSSDDEFENSKCNRSQRYQQQADVTPPKIKSNPARKYQTFITSEWPNICKNMSDSQTTEIFIKIPSNKRLNRATSLDDGIATKIHEFVKKSNSFENAGNKIHLGGAKEMECSYYLKFNSVQKSRNSGRLNADRGEYTIIKGIRNKGSNSSQNKCEDYVKNGEVGTESCTEVSVRSRVGLEVQERVRCQDEISSSEVKADGEITTPFSNYNSAFQDGSEYKGLETDPFVNGCEGKKLVEAPPEKTMSKGTIHPKVKRSPSDLQTEDFLRYELTDDATHSRYNQPNECVLHKLKLTMQNGRDDKANISAERRTNYSESAPCIPHANQGLEGASFHCQSTANGNSEDTNMANGNSTLERELSHSEKFCKASRSCMDANLSSSKDETFQTSDQENGHSVHTKYRINSDGEKSDNSEVHSRDSALIFFCENECQKFFESNHELQNDCSELCNSALGEDEVSELDSSNSNIIMALEEPGVICLVEAAVPNEEELPTLDDEDSRALESVMEADEGLEKRKNGTAEDNSDEEPVLEGRFKNIFKYAEKVKRSSHDEDSDSCKNSSVTDEMLIDFSVLPEPQKEADESMELSGSDLASELSKLEVLESPRVPDNSSEELENDEEVVVRLKRSSSLRCGKTPPGTPGRKKIVRFADALGLDLAAIRTFLEGVPNVPPSAFCDLQVEEDVSEGHQGLPPYSSYSCAVSAAAVVLHSQARRVLTPMFQQPGALPDFYDRLREQKVVLENVTVEADLSVKGVVRVINEDYQKKVLVRYTFDHWKNYHETSASYVDGSSDGFSDRFSFLLWGSFLQSNGALIFCLKYCVKGREFWDSNLGCNYVLKCYSTDPVGLPSLEHSFLKLPQNNGNITEQNGHSEHEANYGSSFSATHPDDPWTTPFF